MLLKVSALMQRFAEARSERATPVQVLRRVLDMVVVDCGANYASVQTVSESTAMMVLMVSPPDGYLDKNRLQMLAAGVGYAAEAVVAERKYLAWSADSPGAPLPSDWAALVAGTQPPLVQVSAVPIIVADKCIGILTLGVNATSLESSSVVMWPPYMQLIAANMSSMIKDTAIPLYIQMVKDVHDTPELDPLIHKLVEHMRQILGHTKMPHMCYRIALAGVNNTAATIFDDLTQVPTPSVRTGSSHQIGSTRLIKDVQANGGVIRSVVSMKSTVMKISISNRQQVMIPDVQKLINQSGNVSSDIFNTRLMKPPTSVLLFPLKVKQHIFGVVFCMSGVQTDFSDVSPRLRELCEVMSPYLLNALTTGLLANEYLEVQEAVPDANASLSGMSFSKMSDAFNVGGSVGGSVSGDQFAFNQSRSSTGALVTGLTEKLNQKRIKSAMDFSASNQLADLQIQHLLGEGGFAKVFRGLWQGLVVGIKIVVDDGKNEKMVMKNAHEIAILSTLSHPHVTQAYLCLTDVMVRDLISTCIRSPHASVLDSPAYAYLLAMEDRLCHVEVIEYCDLGNMSTALKSAVFCCSEPAQVLAALAETAITGASDGATKSSHGERLQVNLRSLLLTLIEIASALGYLHRMGVVHCDIKPANVLLKRSSNDPRGITAKISDFGLSRVEDDDVSSSFPFNSCGTVAYVAPEALISNKKVTSSVDVYAFGVLMWEMYTGQKPYGSMKQQQLVEEVVMRGLRPKFPTLGPATYVQLSQACWSGSPQGRPTFDEVLVVLNNMLQAVDDGKMAGQYSLETTGDSGSVEYMHGFKVADAAGGAAFTCA
ncbi:hypothetical protein FOA52_000771 [Chlamydomonas sp. UWO 241]|nr:hypothetical protein FOA52_000771 [Chlamydomonas sp. UWO 241]